MLNITGKSQKKMYEHRRQQLAPKSIFLRRMRNNLLVSLGILVLSLTIGTIGFYYTCPEQSFTVIDCFHNAAMLLAGMGPTLAFGEGDSWILAKMFSAFYALYAGVILITNIGLLMAPALHRIYHRFHLAEEM